MLGWGAAKTLDRVAICRAFLERTFHSMVFMACWLCTSRRDWMPWFGITFTCSVLAWASCNRDEAFWLFFSLLSGNSTASWSCSSTLRKRESFSPAVLIFSWVV
jgi:hypothetical protein